MESETKHRLIAAFERSCIRAGAKNLDEGLALFCSFADWARAQAKLARDRETFSASLDQMPEPSRAERVVIFAIVEHLPAIVGFFLRQAAAEARKDLPAPPGGRTRVFEPAQEKEICSYIGELQAQGYETLIAKESAARRYRTSVATISRVWKRRKRPYERKPRFQQLIEYIKTGRS